MDIENLDAGQDFDELPDTYTIFITEHDILGRGRPFYQIERVTLDDGMPFQDGSHILYINGEYRDDTPLGKLMHDFSCWNPEDMNYALMEETTRYYKETPEGVEYMCRAFEEVRNESFSRGMRQGMQQNAVSNIRSLMANLNLTPKQAMDALSVPDENRAEYIKMIQA